MRFATVLAVLLTSALLAGCSSSPGTAGTHTSTKAGPSGAAGGPGATTGSMTATLPSTGPASTSGSQSTASSTSSTSGTSSASTSSQPPPEPHSASIMSFAFKPAQINVAAGDSVRWTNLDGAMHSVTADGSGFDTGTFGKDEQRTLMFPTAGTFGFHCKVHPNMTGSITVA